MAVANEPDLAALDDAVKAAEGDAQMGRRIADGHQAVG
jgi:hypothetical protein